MLMRELDPTTLTKNPHLEVIKDPTPYLNKTLYGTIFMYVYIHSDAWPRPHHVVCTYMHEYIYEWTNPHLEVIKDPTPYLNKTLYGIIFEYV